MMKHRTDTQPPKRIGSRLVEAELITPQQLAEALAVQANQGGKIVENLIELGFLTHASFVKFLAQQGLPAVDLSNYDIPDALIQLVTRDIALRHEVIPIDKLGKNLTLAMACPLDYATITELETLTGLRVKPVLCSAEDVRSAIVRYYGSSDNQASDTDSMASYDMASLGLSPSRSIPAAPAAKPGQPRTTAPEQGSVEGLESLIKLGGVAHLVRQIDSLPTLPETVRQIQAIKDSGNGSVAEMADVLTKDPPIAAKLLQVVNSAAYGVPQKVRDIRQAASLLGMNDICSIVFSAAVIDVLGGSDQADYRRYWEDSFRCAHMARVIAKARRRENPVVYFTAGLLHDIGQMALLEVVRMYPGIYNRFSGTELCAEEERSIGLTHMEAGFLLAERWNLPKDICNTIRFHHHPEMLLESLPPDAARDTIADIVATVSVADTIADAHRVMVRDSAEGMQMLSLERGHLADLFRLALDTLDTAEQDNGEAAR